MNTSRLRTWLIEIENAKRENRNRVANLVYQQQEYVKELVDIVFEVDNKLSIRAAWILEWLCTQKDLNLIVPYLDIFSSQIKGLQYDSAIRPCSKICEYLATDYNSKYDNLVKKHLKDNHIDAIIETGFDWLITPQKIAVRAYTMQTLFLFGKYRAWVHPELEHIIRSKTIHESKGCKVRALRVLNEIQNPYK